MFDQFQIMCHKEVEFNYPLKIKKCTSEIRKFKSKLTEYENLLNQHLLNANSSKMPKSMEKKIRGLKCIVDQILTDMKDSPEEIVQNVNENKVEIREYFKPKEGHLPSIMRGNELKKKTQQIESFTDKEILENDEIEMVEYEYMNDIDFLKIMRKKELLSKHNEKLEISISKLSDVLERREHAIKSQIENQAQKINLLKEVKSLK